MYKMVTFDIDGTLVQHLDNEFSEEIIDMFKKLKEKGYIVTLATGRDFISIANLHKTKNIDYFIGANGSFIYDLKNKNFIFNSPIKYDDFEKFQKDILYSNFNDIKCIILSDDQWVYTFENPDIKRKLWFWDAFRNKFKKIEEAKENINKDKFHLITIETSLNSDLHEKASDYFEKTNSSLWVQAWWPKGMFIANKHITKAHSLLKLCNHLNINMSEVIAFGDGENDREMLREVGLGVAMGNASESVKSIANDVTIDVDKYGTKFFLRKMGIIE